MRNVRRRLEMLERLPRYQPPPSLREEIMRLALQTLSQQDLECLPSAESDAHTTIGTGSGRLPCLGERP